MRHAFARRIKEGERKEIERTHKSDNVGMVQRDCNCPADPRRLLFVFLQIQLDKSE